MVGVGHLALTLSPGGKDGVLGCGRGVWVLPSCIAMELELCGLRPVQSLLWAFVFSWKEACGIAEAL